MEIKQRVNLILVIITTISITINIVGGMKLFDLPPEWLVNDVEQLQERLNDHIAEHK